MGRSAQRNLLRALTESPRQAGKIAIWHPKRNGNDSPEPVRGKGAWLRGLPHSEHVDTNDENVSKEYRHKKQTHAAAHGPKNTTRNQKSPCRIANETPTKAASMCTKNPEYPEVEHPGPVEGSTN